MHPACGSAPRLGNVGPAEPIDVTGMQVNVQITVAADAGIVWDLLAEITNVGKWSPECVHAAWLNQADARPGVRFSGRNRVPDGFEWTVTCVITEADRPRAFAWIVLDDSEDSQAADHPSSSWRYDLGPAPQGGTLVRHRFTHGPGDSGVRWMMRKHPEQAAEIVEDRRKQLRSNMLDTLAAMRAAAAEVRMSE